MENSKCCSAEILYLCTNNAKQEDWSVSVCSKWKEICNEKYLITKNKILTEVLMMLKEYPLSHINTIKQKIKDMMWYPENKKENDET